MVSLEKDPEIPNRQKATPQRSKKTSENSHMRQKQVRVCGGSYKEKVVNSPHTTLPASPKRTENNTLL